MTRPSDFRITEGEIAEAMYSFEIDGMGVSFSLDSVSPEDRQRFGEMITETLITVAERAEHKAKAELQLQMRRLLGL